MKLEYDPLDTQGLCWTASTDDENYDGSGRTAMTAVCNLVVTLETAIRDEVAGT